MNVQPLAMLQGVVNSLILFYVVYLNCQQRCQLFDVRRSKVRVVLEHDGNCFFSHCSVQEKIATDQSKSGDFNSNEMRQTQLGALSVKTS